MIVHSGLSTRFCLKAYHVNWQQSCLTITAIFVLAIASGCGYAVKYNQEGSTENRPPTTTGPQKKILKSQISYDTTGAILLYDLESEGSNLRIRNMRIAHHQIATQRTKYKLIKADSASVFDLGIIRFITPKATGPLEESKTLTTNEILVDVQKHKQVQLEPAEEYHSGIGTYKSYDLATEENGNLDFNFAIQNPNSLAPIYKVVMDSMGVNVARYVDISEWLAQRMVEQIDTTESINGILSQFDKIRPIFAGRAKALAIVDTRRENIHQDYQLKKAHHELEIGNYQEAIGLYRMLAANNAEAKKRAWDCYLAEADRAMRSRKWSEALDFCDRLMGILQNNPNTNHPEDNVFAFSKDIDSDTLIWYREVTERKKRAIAVRMPDSKVDTYEIASMKYETGLSLRDLILGSGREGIYEIPILEIIQCLGGREYLVTVPGTYKWVFHCVIPSYSKINDLVVGSYITGFAKARGVYNYITAYGYNNTVKNIEFLYVKRRF